MASLGSVVKLVPPKPQLRVCVCVCVVFLFHGCVKVVKSREL